MSTKGRRKNPESGEWSGCREGAPSSADWPSPFPQRVPLRDCALEPPERWVPEHPGRAVTVCAIRDVKSGQPTLEILEWADLAEAAEAAALLFDRPCGPVCRKHHAIVFTTESGVCVRSLPSSTPEPSRAQAFVDCYPKRKPKRKANGRLPLEEMLAPKPEFWPTPANFNERLSPPNPSAAPCPPRTSVSRPIEGVR